jgi:phosphoribosylaminoimidazole carboxylase (NCAIR synthetase)
MPTDEEVVQTAAEAAEGVIFARYKQSEVTDFDVTVTFEAGILEVDVYVNAPDSADDAETVADEAARAAQDAVDELFEASDG